MRFAGPKLKKKPDNPHPFADVHINYSIGNRQRKKTVEVLVPVPAPIIQMLNSI
jgi:hypothetical protein